MTFNERATQRNADVRFFAGAKFEVVERATGQAIPGKPMDYFFASYVRDVRNFGTDAYFIRGCN